MLKLKIFFLFIVLTSICYSQHPRENISGKFLIQTKWNGSQPFNMVVPNNYELGCHSVAIAQVLFFHKLVPHEKVNYICSNGIKVERDFSNYTPDFDSLAYTSNDIEERLRKTSEYIYNIASIVKKDFGTDQYLKCDDYHKSEIESHLNCKYQAYFEKIDGNLAAILHRDDGYYSKITKEIEAGRPLGFYYSNNKNIGHAVVIDGYVQKEDKIFIHANFGWGGKSDGWYLLEEDLPKDLQYMLLITIDPLPK